MANFFSVRLTNYGIFFFVSCCFIGPLIAQPSTQLKFAIIPDTQGRDDAWGENRVVLPDDETTHVGIDWNRDGYYDGEGFLIDVGAESGSYWQPRVVLDGNGQVVTVATPADFPLGYRHLPRLLTDPLVSKIIDEEVDLVLAVGDLTDLRTELEYQQWMDLVAAPLISQGIDVYPVRGNHEIVDGNDWPSWFDDRANVGKRTSVNNLDNGVDAYEANDRFDQGYQLYQAYPGTLLQEKISNAEVTGYPGIEDLVYYFVEGDALFIGVDYYFSDLIDNRYRGSWPLLLPWLTDVLEKHQDKVKHRFIYAHEPLAPKKRPLSEARLSQSTDDENIFGLDIGQIGYMQLQQHAHPQLTDEVLALFAEHQVIYIAGHDHQYSRSLIHAPQGTDISDSFMQIISGNASWKGYNNRFGASQLYETALSQDNFVDSNNGLSKKISFLIVEINDRQLSVTNWFLPHDFSEQDMSQGAIWDNDERQWQQTEYQPSSGEVVLNHIDADWQVGDQFSFTHDSSRRVVSPNQNYGFFSQAPSDQGFIGSSAAIYDGYNLTFDSAEVLRADSTSVTNDQEDGSGLYSSQQETPHRIERMNELLALSWFSDDSAVTHSDILLLDGIEQQKGKLINTNGIEQPESPANHFVDSGGIERVNPNVSAPEIVADTIALSMSVSDSANIEDLSLARWDESLQQWQVVTDPSCFIDTGYSDDFSIAYGTDERGRLPSNAKNKNGEPIPNTCRLRLWGYNHNNQTIWAMINRQGRYAIVDPSLL